MLDDVKNHHRIGADRSCKKSPREVDSDQVSDSQVSYEEDILYIRVELSISVSFMNCYTLLLYEFKSHTSIGSLIIEFY